MMYALDLTPVFDQLLKSNEGKPTARRRFDAAKTEGFLKEAYRINNHIATLSKQLGDVRQAYLSTAPPRRTHHHHHHHHRQHSPGTVTSLTDAQREDIDANAKRLLRDLNASIRGLAEAETLHQETQQALIRKQHAGPSLRLPGFLGGGGGGDAKSAKSLSLLPKSAEQAAAEDAQKQAAAHHESVLWYLRQRLQACGQAQQTMMEARLARMVVETSSQHALLAAAAAAPAPAAVIKRTPSGSSQSRGAAADVSAAAALEEEQLRAMGGGQQGQGGFLAAGGPAGDPEAGLTQEQIQMFERGNQDMLKHYETTLEKVRAAEQSLVEISELQTMLVGNLEVQSAHVDQMVADSVSTAENVAKGNRELKKALERPSTARYTFYAASGLCLFVVVWDFFV